MYMVLKVFLIFTIFILSYQDLGLQDSEPHGFESSRPVRPLRYTPGLKCDNALEAMRPERDMKHQALQVHTNIFPKPQPVPIHLDISYFHMSFSQAGTSQAQAATSLVCPCRSTRPLVHPAAAPDPHCSRRRLRRPNLTFGKLPLGNLHI